MTDFTRFPVLTVQHNCLHLGDNLLLRVYPAGDCDSCPWPGDYSKGTELQRRLTHALYDAIETGELEHDAVMLPDNYSVFSLT